MLVCAVILLDEYNIIHILDVDRCGSSDTDKLSCVDTENHSVTIWSTIKIDRPIGSTLFRNSDKCCSSRVILCFHYEKRRI